MKFKFFLIELPYSEFVPHSSDQALKQRWHYIQGHLFIAETLEYGIYAWVKFHEGIVKR